MERPEDDLSDIYPEDSTQTEDDRAGDGRQPADPAEVAAALLIRCALDADPTARAALAAACVAVVIEVPGAAWAAPLAEAWGRVVWPGRGEPVEGDVAKFSPRWRPKGSPGWVAFRRDGAQRSHKPSEGNATVAAALAAGYGVCGFSPAPGRHLPRDLLRAADIRIALPLPDADTLAETAAAVFGGRPSSLIPEALCRLADVGDLRLARRPDQDADGYTARLHALLEAKAASPALTLDSLHGMDEAVAWGEALARDLADYRRGLVPWSAVDRGVLLYGPPGTGKTTFAQALAGTCRVPLVCGSLNRWQASGSGHLGDLLKAMAATFGEARSTAPSILFIDEIDAFGDRASFTSEYKDYWVQVVNGLLEELDGVGGRDGVVVVGACNHPGRLDPAITRSGRLERAIHVPLPDPAALACILRHHLGADLAGADLSTAALLALGGTGADCERWVRGARRRARYGRRAMGLDDLLAEIRGAERPRPPEDVYRYAVHEAGHALVLALECPGTLLCVSVQETADSQGGTMAERDGRRPMTRREIATRLRMLLAGRAAEEVVLGDVSTGAGGGAESDLARATTLAASALHAYGLGDGGEGLLWRGLPTPDTLASALATRSGLDGQVARLLAEAYAAAMDLVRRHRPAVERLARALANRETIDGREVEAMLREQDGRIGGGGLL